MRYVVILLLAGIAFGQTVSGGHCSKAMIAWIPSEILERPTTLQRANVQYAVGASLLADHPDTDRCERCGFWRITSDCTR
jgi:hypothetical protein